MRELILITVFALCYILPVKADAQKLRELVIAADDMGFIMAGRDTVGSDNMDMYIRDRLIKSYMGTGQMYDKIRLQKMYGGPPTTVMEVLINEIKAGQQLALRDLCLQKFSRRFEMLDKKKQARLRKQFPVLFQNEYITSN